MIPKQSQDEASPVPFCPSELLALRERVLAQPAAIRAELEPLVDEAIEDARFRRQAMNLARDALAQFRLSLALAEFDLQVTQGERERYRVMARSD